MDIKDIQDLIKLVNRSSLTEVEIENGDFRLKIRRKGADNNVIYTSEPTPYYAPQPAPAGAAAPVPTPAPTPAPAESSAPATPANNANLIEFKSPMIGTFYRSPSPEAELFAKVGDVVSKGQVLCIIEAMKLFNEIESEVNGKIVKILVDDARPVEYDQPLFLIDTSITS
ncbi:MAG: acetyl-CoA carboxylase biotin carboxyl carrier protein [Bacteroidia bacterium]|nr:acetyl-CoA carboxylase biotin carboxyl carrier protein [Bacteroidia bacterium]